MTEPSYVLHVLRDKPLATLLAGLLSGVLHYFQSGWGVQLLNLGAICALVAIDWLTALYACRKRGLPVTSHEMRTRGVVKLRDYLILCIAGAISVPLLGEWGYRTVLVAIGTWELWSIAENLHDAGTLPFDIRHMSLASGLRRWRRRDDS